MNHKKVYLFETVLGIGMIVFNAAALMALIYFVSQLIARHHVTLAKNELYLFVFLITLLGIGCLYSVLQAVMQNKRHSAEKTFEEKPYHQLYDKNSFARMLRMELRRSGRYHLPLTLCFVGLDKNDEIHPGHPDLEKVFKSFGELMARAIRSSDSLARYGQNEFCVLLCHTDLVHAENFVMRMLWQTQERLDVSFSVGITCYRIGENDDDFLERAQSALMQAQKTGGRKTCCVIGRDGISSMKSLI